MSRLACVPAPLLRWPIPSPPWLPAPVACLTASVCCLVCSGSSPVPCAPRASCRRVWHSVPCFFLQPSQPACSCWSLVPCTFPGCQPLTWLCAITCSGALRSHGALRASRPPLTREPTPAPVASLPGLAAGLLPLALCPLWRCGTWCLPAFPRRSRGSAPLTASGRSCGFLLLLLSAFWTLLGFSSPLSSVPLSLTFSVA